MEEIVKPAMEEMELYSGSRVPKRYLSGVESWICDSGMDMFSEGYHLMTKMFVEYVYYCKLYDIEPICTDRLFSKSLQKLGYPMKRSRYGTMFCINQDEGGTDCEGADSAYGADGCADSAYGADGCADSAYEDEMLMLDSEENEF